MKARLYSLLVLIFLGSATIVAAQETNDTTVILFEPFGIFIALVVVGLMLFLAGNFLWQLWRQNRREQSQAPTEKTAIVETGIPSHPQVHGSSPYIPVPTDIGDSPTMILELVKAPLNTIPEGQQWFITQQRTPFLIGAGTPENRNLDIVIADDYVSAFHLRIEFEPSKQCFVAIDTDSYNGSRLNGLEMAANVPLLLPRDKAAELEISRRYVFTAQQVKGGELGVEKKIQTLELNLENEEATAKAPAVHDGIVEVATSKLPDIEEFEPIRASTGEVATLQEAPDMSTLPNVRYPLQNVDFPPLARLPEDVDALIEVLRSPQVQASAYTISRTVYHIGRSDKTDLRLPGAMISNNHCSLYWAKNTFWIVDTSLNQTWLRWEHNEIGLERAVPVSLDVGREYHIILARDENMLRFRYVLETAERDAQEATLPPLPVGIQASLKMLRVGTAEEYQDFELNSNKISIGRESSNLVRLHPQVISRRHAEIVWKLDAYYLQDKRSLFGTQLDSILLPSGGEQRLEPDQTYQIVLSPSQKDAVHLEFRYLDGRGIASN